MSNAFPYIVSYFAVGLLFAASGLRHGLFGHGRVLFASLFTLLFWPVLVLVAPESLLWSMNQADLATRHGDSLMQDLAHVAQPEAPSLSDDERVRLAKVARYGDDYISFFENCSDFEGILNGFWNQNVPPEVYHRLNRATHHLEESFDPATEPRFSLRPPDWYIGFSTEFVKSITKVDRKKQGRILEAIGKIAAAPMEVRGDTIKPLAGKMSGLWRCRLGNDRLIYYPHSDSRKVVLISFASRSEAYEETIDVAALTPR